MTGTVLRIEKTSIHDGEGLRTVVFLKGCPLKCKWCSTPESQSAGIESGYGTEMQVAEVVMEIAKDEIFFFHSQGGVTISEGEPLMQSEFCEAILQECSYRGIHTAIESSFYAKYEDIERLLPFLGDIYMDLKLMDPGRHEEYTGVSNKIILDNLQKIQESDFGGNIHIRIPAIPTVNMDADNIRATAVFCAGLQKLTDVELLPYHRLGLETYRKLKRHYELEDILSPAESDLKEAADIMHQYLKDKLIIF